MSSISTLPAELLRVIVDNFCLPNFTSPARTEKLEVETRKTLYSLSLTSQTFRQLARPLLFAFVRFDRKDGHERLELLVENNRGKQVLETIRTVVFEPQFGKWREQIAYDSDPVAELAKAAAGLEQLLVKAESFDLTHFTGSSIRRLFLQRLSLNSYILANLFLPSLEFLGIYDTVVDPGTIDRKSFPALRHLAFDSSMVGDLWKVGPGETVPLQAQLDTVLLLVDVFEIYITSLAPSFVEKILVTCPLDFLGSLFAVEFGVVNVRLCIATCYPRPSNFEELARNLDEFADRCENPRMFQRLRTVYLPFLDSISIPSHQDLVLASIDHIIAACLNRNVEVVFEEQSNEYKVETILSEEFMKRMTARRLDKEKQSGEN